MQAAGEIGGLSVGNQVGNILLTSRPYLYERNGAEVDACIFSWRLLCHRYYKKVFTNKVRYICELINVIRFSFLRLMRTARSFWCEE